jgi:thioredoxin reductase (NADPH)
VRVPTPGACYEAAVIGAGPAGSATAMQLKRYGIEPLVFDKERVGGLLRNANLVENYPGFPDGIPGPELIARIERQLRRLGVEVIQEEVFEVDYRSGSYCVNTRSGCWYARRLILATGTEPCPIEIPVPKGAARRVYSEVYPLLEKRDLQVLIVGGGDAAFDYALNLARLGWRVTILNRSDSVRCLPLLWTRVQDCPDIGYLPNTEILSVEEDRQGKKLTALCASPEGITELTADYLLFAIGRRPSLSILSLGLQQQSETLIQQGLLHLVGDVKNGIFRQTAIAVGDGLRAAMQICRDYERQPSEAAFISRRH